jgi:hypothetical protein
MTSPEILRAENGSLRRPFVLFLTSVRISWPNSGLSVRFFPVAMRLGTMNVKGASRSGVARKVFSLDPTLKLRVRQFGVYAPRLGSLDQVSSRNV